jgi:hypothetical protein
MKMGVGCMKKNKRILIIIVCTLLLLFVGGYALFLYSVGNAFEGIAEMLANDFQINFERGLLKTFYDNEETFRKMDSIALKLMDSNSEGVLGDSTKQCLESSLLALNSYDDTQFHSNWFQISWLNPIPNNPRLPKTWERAYYWGFAWIPKPLELPKKTIWTRVDKKDFTVMPWSPGGGSLGFDNGYSSEFLISKEGLPGAWYLYIEKNAAP